MKNLKVSVVIPVYNGEKTLGSCLESVLNQTYADYEVIVVNNNSTDKTRDIIKECQIENEKVQYVFEGYRSRGAARNAGIKAVKGEIVAMTDSDCIVPPEWLSELTGPIISGDETVVVGSDSDVIRTYWTKNIQKSMSEFMKRNLNKGYISHIDTKNLAIKTSLIKELMFDPKLHHLEDFDLFLRIRKKAKVRFLPSVFVGHNHKNSFIKTVMLNFNRGYWVTRVYKKHKSIKSGDYPMTESISIKNFISFPFWMMLQFIKRPISEAFFLFVSETSWRAGIIRALIRNENSSLP